MPRKGSDKQNEKTAHILGENIANDVTNKGLVSSTYKELMMLNSIKTNNLINKWGEESNRHFSKEDIQKANWHMERSSTSLIIRKIKVKSSMRYHLIPIQIAIIKKINKKKINAGEGIERGDLPTVLVGI